MKIGEKYKLHNQPLHILSVDTKPNAKVDVRLNKLLGKMRVSDIQRLKKIS